VLLWRGRKVYSHQRVVEGIFADQEDHTGDRLNRRMMIKIPLVLGMVFGLTLGAYAQFPGETAPGIKVSQKETSKVGHKRTLKRPSAKKKVAQLPDEQTAHKLRRFVSEFVSASGSRSTNRDQRRFFAKRANYLGKTNLSRTAIGATMRRFNTVWPKRHYTAKGKPVIAGPFDGDRYTVKLSIAWTLSNEPWESRGVGLLRFRIRRLAAGKFEILSMIETEHFSHSARYFGCGYG
jgi:hypothetical protein